ncbi:hypothetical protein AZI86_01825 [Bdellovibrio bacteriovorus]|uniref:4-vinyl reductase 4VR domain-containing protein n=1 Tax=Bdellovibrio bacteriovorus TaxID=959 RepID=A0A150WNE8_BDEBC|nr:hypothetical protein [Bdellovibrio bacteriovorus]KYG65837.1 hypothetical protein AZI86_01825 [Bdellovibrio bacteriovorus]
MDTLERLRVVTDIDDSQWQDLLQLTWWDYVMVRSGKKQLSEQALLRLSEYFDSDPRAVITGKVDFHSIQIQSEKSRWEMPDAYAVANYGRRRTTITTFEYIERNHGWRLRYEVLKHLGLSESILTDPFAPISMQVITDALAYLGHRHFTAKDFFAMGMYSYSGNVNTLLGRFYSELETSKEVIEHMWGDCLNFYEKNCRYRFLKLNEEGALLEVSSDPHVAQEMETTHLGNEYICSLKAGMMASAPMYRGEAPAKVIERCCVHHGAPACVFEITFAKGVLYHAANLNFA